MIQDESGGTTCHEWEVVSFSGEEDVEKLLRIPAEGLDRTKPTS